jgi:hypothetical protein
MATALAHVQKAPPRLDQLRPELPTGLSDLVGSLLVKDPDYRVGSALALGAALTSVGKRAGGPANEPGAYLHIGASKGVAARSGRGRPGREAPVPNRAAPGGIAPNGGASATDPVVPAKMPGGTLTMPKNGSTARLATQGERRRPPRHYRTGRVTGVVVLCLLVVGSLVALTLSHPTPVSRAITPPTGGQNSSRPTTTAPLAPPNSYAAVQVVAVHEMAVGGNTPDDDLSGLDNVIGNNPNAFWHSDRYTQPDFGGYGGLGLVLQLSGVHTLHELVVTTPMQDWSAETFVSSSDAPQLSGWGQPTGQRSGVNNSSVFSLGGKKAGWVLFWMLNPGPTDQAVIDKLSVR